MASQPCSLVEVTSDADFSQYTSAFPQTGVLVIYFHAPWAEPCKQMGMVLRTLASTYSHTQPQRIGFLALDAEELSDISEHYEVSQVPYIVIQKNGEVLETVSGGDAGRVRAAVEKHAGAAETNPGRVGLPPAQVVSKPEGTKNLSSYAPGPNDPQTAPQYSAQELETSKEELWQRLGELVKAAPVMLFMKGTPSAPQCGFSRQTVSILREKGVRYGFFNILADDDVRQGLKEYADWPTFPQVWVGGELVGGLDILKEEFENDPEFLNDYSVGQKRQAAA